MSQNPHDQGQSPDLPGVRPGLPGLRLEIPGRELLHLRHLLLDYNGTLACDGQLLPGLVPRLQALARLLDLTLITADTFGTVRGAVHQAGLENTTRVHTLPPGPAETESKREYQRSLGQAACCAIGNGVNDALMLEEAGLGIAVIGKEGCALAALGRADLVVNDIADALDLLLHHGRATATLRS